MPGVELHISSDILIQAAVVLLYAPVALFSYWRLIPRLSLSAKRLAAAMLAAQVVVILLALSVAPASKFEYWLWDFHEEWNIPSTFAYLQLATVGGVALLTARYCRVGQRLYLVGTGLVFVFLAVDEYLALHEVVPNWELRYVALGLALVAATLFVAWRSPRSSWRWHFVLLAGLALSVAGAMLVNALPIHCGSLGVLRFDGCLEFFFLEESFEFLGIWLTLIAMLGHFSGASRTRSPSAIRLLYTLPLLGGIVLLGNVLLPRFELGLIARPAEVQFASGVQLRGYQISAYTGSRIIRIYSTAAQANYIGVGYSIHLVDQETGESVASRDEWADRQHGIWLLGGEYAPLYRQWMDVAIPPDAATNRALWVVLTLWRKRGGEFDRLKVRSSDLPLLDDKQVILDELVLQGATAASSSAQLAVFAGGFALEEANLPERAKAGETLEITFAWRADAAGVADTIQFLHLGNEATDEWFIYDQQPLGARLPTRLWYPGLADSETWQVRLPADLARGRYAVYTGLYRARDIKRLSATNSDGAPWLDNRVALDYVLIE